MDILRVRALKYNMCRSDKRMQDVHENKWAFRVEKPFY
jgi:hypothetical protein